MGIFVTTDLEFISMRQEEGGVHSFAFKPLTPFRHIAGQHGLLTLPRGGTKPYSLASAPEDAEVMIGTRLQSYSSYKRALAKLRPGQRVSLRGPVLNFTLRSAPRRVIFLAQGVGVTPFRSMLRHTVLANLDHLTTLIHVGEGHAYRTETEGLATTAIYPINRDEFRGAVEAVVLDQPDARYYISGAGRFISQTLSVLAQLGVARKQIKKAKFFGYRDNQSQLASSPN